MFIIIILILLLLLLLLLFIFFDDENMTKASENENHSSLICSKMMVTSMLAMFHTSSGVSRVWQVGQVPLNRFVFDICYPIDIFNGLNFDFVR